MKPTFFLVASRGYMATSWLTNALNRLPATLAIHGSSPENGLFADLKSYPEKFANVDRAPSMQRYGFLHTVNASSILRDVLAGDYDNLTVATAQLVRNPVMLAECMACAVLREWHTDTKYKMAGDSLRADVLADRWGSNSVTWPDSVKAAVLEGHDGHLARLTGIWMRTKTEAVEVFNYEVVKHYVTTRGLAANLHHYPFFRFEEYTKDVAAFRALVEHLMGSGVDGQLVAKAFGAPKTNQNRKDGDPDDPALVYGAWSRAERDLFSTIMSLTGLRHFSEDTLKYDISYVDLVEVEAPELNSEKKFPGITMNWRFVTES